MICAVCGKVPKALAELFVLARALNKSDDKDEQEKLAAALYASGDLMGLLGTDPEQWFAGHVEGALPAEEIEALIEQRNAAKVRRDFELADSIRDQLKKAGITIQDSREGTTWRRGT